MKLFYIIAAVAVIVLAATPFLLIEGQADSYEGVVQYGTYSAKIKSIDPATCGDTTSAGVQGAFYESLYAYHYLKRPVELMPQLAEAMPEVSPDGLTYTIRLRKDIRYCRNECFGRQADGEPATRTVRADDFVLAFKRIADYHITTSLSLAFIEDKIAGILEYRDRTRTYDKGDFSRYDLPLEGVKALDDHTLQIRLTVPFPQLLHVLAVNCYAPVPREVIDYHLSTRPDAKGARRPIPMKERSPEILEKEAAVGTGAYYLAEWVKGNRLILKRNGEFRQEFYPSEGAPGDKEAGLLDDAGKPVPLIDVSHMIYVEENNPMWMMFLTRRTDTAGIPQEIYTRVIAPDRELTEDWKKQGIQLIKYSDPAIYWYGFNMEDPVLSASRSLRQALCLSFNVEQYIEVLFNGRGIRAVSYVPNTFEAYKEAGPGPYARFDLPAAREKIGQARRELEAAGVIKPGQDIPALTLDLAGRDEDFRRMGEFAQQQFAQIGVKLNVELNDWPTLQAKVHNKQTQMYAMGWHADYPDPENFLQLFYSPNIKRGTNNTNYSNAEFDKLFERAAVMMPSPERTDLYVRMILMLNEDCPTLLLTEPIGFFLAHSWVHNVKPHPIGYGFLMYRRIDAEARRQAGGR